MKTNTRLKCYFYHLMYLLSFGNKKSYFKKIYLRLKHELVLEEYI